MWIILFCLLQSENTGQMNSSEQWIYTYLPTLKDIKYEKSEEKIIK